MAATTSARRPPLPKRRRSRPSASSEPQYLAIGQVLRPHGVRGELRLAIYTQSPAHLDEVKTVYVGEAHKPYPLEWARLHQKILLIKLKGCEDRAQADELRGEVVSVALAEAAPLKPNQFYHHQIIGLAVISEAGEDLGTVTEIIQTGANDVYVVKQGETELLLPAIKSVILKVDPPQITVHLLEGLR